MTRRWSQIAVWLCVLCAGAPSMARAAAAAWGLPQLMRGLGQVHAASGHFVERKTIHVLNAPLTASGKS